MKGPTPIKLKLPRQDLPELKQFRPDSDSVRQWVQGLPVSNTVVVAENLNDALDDLNRTTLPPAVRYGILETLTPSLEAVLSKLAKRFLKQPLVIPPEPRKMAEDSARLMSAATTAYAIVAIEAIQQADSISDANPARLACESLQRALLFSGKKVLQTYQLHQPMEPNTWEILHQLYALAEYQSLDNLPIPEPRDGGSTIKATYAQALIISCCKPNQLRQGELAALYRALQSWGEWVQFEARENGDELFLVDFNSDQPAQYRTLYREHPSTGCRAINTTELLVTLRTLKTNLTERQVSFDKNTSISVPLLDHLINSFDSVSLRNFKRTASNSPLWICVGLSSTHYQVSIQQLRQPTDGSSAPKSSPGRGANPFMNAANNANGKRKHSRLRTADRELQNVVGVELDASTRARLLEEKPDNSGHGKHPVFQVQLANTSANGYCLEWINDVPADIRSGDIVGLKEDKEDNEWAIAVIRWLSRLEDSKTLVGLELLSPRAIAYGGSAHLKGGEKGTPVRVLHLPEIKIVGQPNTLITPRAHFKEQQKLTLVNNTQSCTVQLLRQICSTGGFDQFEFRYIKELGDLLAEKQREGGGEFDSLWSNI